MSRSTDPFAIFTIEDEASFLSISLEIFREQLRDLPVYRAFCSHLGRDENNVHSLEEIPFLPVEFFKTHELIRPGKQAEAVFRSSGTTGMTTSRHPVADLELYAESFLRAFTQFYGRPEKYCILALLPSYRDRPDSSLIYMVESLINLSEHPHSGFIGGSASESHARIIACDQGDRPVLLIGVSFALLDLAREHRMQLSNTLVMETGGMKGRKKEMVREALHQELCQGFGVDRIHSEYGMTELLSQAYSKGYGRFYSPPWMRILPRDPEDPLSFLGSERTGGLNIIDLANRYSCSFLATQDLGKIYEDGSFEVLGRFDHSDVRGCNLMAL